MKNKRLTIKNIADRLEKLERKVFNKEKVHSENSGKKIDPNKNINYSLNPRAFVKRYASGKSGEKKFTILVAYYAGGEIGKDVGVDKIRRRWNRMTGKQLLGGKFNTKYSTEAIGYGWVDSKKRGMYNLTEEWVGVL